ncbi:arylsulfatase [Rhizobium leguminosarum]|uniref:Arylsulfatase n=1 Tax=Rhizobium leguminosarum TaxID=384 RepID=A0A2K9ZES1_RHILE|nr:arylsulfatase [Rhizobium leguminosarum]AUW46718.1 Arylsulfatase [Rhizobium leguminosarum]
MSKIRNVCLDLLASAFVAIAAFAPAAAQDQKKPNIVVIMGDDIGWFNIGAYHRGMMSGKTPNIDQLAHDGMMFTDYYAEASCTAGRAQFITGELPIRTGMTTVGQAGSPIGLPAEAITLATALKDMGYATGQFGKNHLGDLNEFLPTVHGFDEFFGYLYHLDAMSDPFWPGYPKELSDKIGPRNLLHSFATDTSDPTVDPRWGKVGKQRIVDEGPLPPHPTDGIKHNMENIDNEILKYATDFMERSQKDGKPFFLWLNPTRMHIFTFLSPKYKALEGQNNYGLQEAGMTEFDDIIGSVMNKLKEMGLDENTIVMVTTDNGTEVFTWPDGGNTPFKGTKGMTTEGGFRSPAIIRWPGKIPAGAVQNGIMSGLDWLPTFVAAAGNDKIGDELKAGKAIGDTTYKVHLDGYNQMDMLTGKGDSRREEVFYFGESSLGAVRIGDWKYSFIDQPDGWPGEHVKLNMPTITNLRRDPFERYSNTNWGVGSADYFMSFYAREFWRFVFVQQQVGELAKSAIEFPPMQKGASFNLDAVKAQIEEAMKAKAGQ